MQGVCVRAYGKINLSLDVLGKRPDGYHDVDMIMQSIDLWDEIIIRKTDKEIELQSDLLGLPLDRGNIVFRAVELIKEKYGIHKGANIFIKKNIPVAAGMAGGSADCAGVLLGLNLLWGLDADEKALRDMGRSLGADVPFCLMGGSAQSRGIGDILTPIDSAADIWLVIIKPDFGLSTGQVYGGLNLNNIGKRPDNQAIIEALGAGDLQSLSRNMVNVLEGVIVPMYPELEEIKSKLRDYGALASLMTGSGPSVYGIFENKSSAERAGLLLEGKYKQVYILRTKRKGLAIKPLY